MKKLKLPAQFAQALPNNWQLTLLAVCGVYAIYKFSQGLSRVDDAAKVLTAPLGSAWSNLAAWSNGWAPVEMNDLRIMSHYLDDSYKLTPEAKAVLSKVPEYQPTLKLWFSNNDVMKPEYRQYIVESQ